MISKERILREVNSLPMLPHAIAQLQEVARDELSWAKEIEDVIRTDPSLTTNLLKLANSAYFGYSRQISSVRHAVALLGVKRVLDVAAGAWFAQIIPPKLSGYEIEAKNFRLHCIAVAVFSEHLAKELKLKTPDLVFTAGILHDIGKLAVGVFLHENQKELLDSLHEKKLSLIDGERQVLGTDHAEVGGILAGQWKLPEFIVEAVRWHHSPHMTQNQEFVRAIELVHIADGLAHSLGFGTDIGELARQVDYEVMNNLGIKSVHLERVACEVLEEIGDMAKVFDGNTEGN